MTFTENVFDPYSFEESIDNTASVTDESYLTNKMDVLLPQNDDLGLENSWFPHHAVIVHKA